MTRPSAPSYDLESAALFVETIAGSASPATFQTFSDRGDGNKSLCRVLHGSISKDGFDLVRLNECGAGVFMMINAGDGRGRKAQNVVEIRAVFLDLDGAPLSVVANAPIRPHVIVESSPGRWHVYWLVSGCSLDQFSAVQTAMARRFDGDRSITDLPRVMRVPGFYHHKGNSVRVRLHQATQSPLIPINEFFHAFSLQIPISVGGTEDGQKKTEEDRMSFSNLLSSSVRETEPEFPGQRNGRIFDFARRMKAIYPDAKVGERREMVRTWHANALPNIRSKDVAVSIEDFERAWVKIKTPHGVELEVALGRQEKPPASLAKLGYGPQASLLVEIMFRLHLHQQERHKGAPIIMGARKAAELIKVDKESALKILKCLERDGLLKLIEKGEGRRASRWKWNWPEI